MRGFDIMPEFDRERFSEIYERNHPWIYRVCFAYMKNAPDAEDCTEDAFVRLLDARPSLEDEKHERAWLTVAAMNVCRDRLRRWRRRRTVPEDLAEQLPDEDGEERREVLDAVMRLPGKYKDVVVLYYYLGYKSDEVALVLRESPSTVRNRLAAARRRLRGALGGNAE
jgi:RNA polymerase sigma-70 factor (ECF subfamily)